jgi:hypothetical protein
LVALPIPSVPPAPPAKLPSVFIPALINGPTPGINAATSPTAFAISEAAPCSIPNVLAIGFVAAAVIPAAFYQSNPSANLGIFFTFFFIT